MDAPSHVSPQTVENAPAAPTEFYLLKGPGAYVPVTPWSPLGGVAGAVAVFVGVLAAVGLCVVAAMQVSLGMDDVIVQIMVTLIQQVAMIALTWYAATRYGGKAYEVLALRAPAQGWQSLRRSPRALAGSHHRHHPNYPARWHRRRQNDIKMFEGMFKSQWWWLALILVGIGAPLSEELLCRGFLFSALAKSRVGIWGASVITSLIFALVHPYSIVAVIQVFVIGMLFAFILVRTGSLRVPIICHSIFNTLQGLALYYAATNP